MPPGPRTLLDNRLPWVPWIADGDRVPVENDSEATWAYDDGGTTWVRKRHLSTGYQPLLAEALGWLMAKALDVPTPDGAIYRRCPDLDASWLSQAIEDCVHWSPSLAGDVENLGELGRALALDLVVLNGDRHSRNILLRSLNRGTPPAFRAYAIDTGRALVGSIDEFADAVGRYPDVGNVARGLPIAKMREGAREASRDAAVIPRGEIERYIREACDFAAETEEGRIVKLTDSLMAQCALAPALVEPYLDAIEALR